ncbi:MAG: hypothetical protein HOV86_26670 [Thermoactinospora sp.]|nr:hypothetical protein [Thermoactinospora sp.]
MRTIILVSTLLFGLPTASHGGSVGLEVLSSAPDQVTGGDALISVERGPRLKVTRNGEDVTALFADSGTVLVDGLRLGENTITATNGRARASLRLVNHPIGGPVFSGPQQYPFVCKTERSGLGPPVVDNQDGQGYRVEGGWSRDCFAPRVTDRLYRSTGGQFKPMPDARPDDMSQTTLLDGTTVDFVVTRERGVINRFIYSLAVLEGHWNKRAIYRFDGGVAIGHDQGTLGGSALDPYGLGKGYAILHSSGTRTSTHYNLILGGETALMVKERFVELYGRPLYTVGVGGSGGGIQQYIYGQNHGSRIIDAAIPQYSYPDMVTQTIHVGDCELLERYMDQHPDKWAQWDKRTALIGMNASDTVANPYTGRPGSTECVKGWRGLTPLSMNPKWTDDNDPEWARMDPPGVKDTVHWTHWEDVKNVYGVGPDGYARSTWDNVGVQYGLGALTDGVITPAEFMDLNATVGSWKEARDMVQEGCPFVPSACPADFDPWSARNAHQGDPAPRRTGDPAAIRNVQRSGLVFGGDIDIPIIDWRHYLEEELDMHNSHQSFASRQRMLDHDRDARNQVIWFTDGPARFDQTPEALQVIDEWMAGILANPRRGVAGNKPALAVDRCFTTEGAQIAAGPDVWNGILDRRSPGACTRAFPLYSTSRIVAGGPIEGGVYACRRQPVERAVARGLYGSWRPSAAERARLKQIFPTGVCDY